MKVSELQAGPTLNGLTAIAQGWTKDDGCSLWHDGEGLRMDAAVYAPSDNIPAQAFELIEKFKINLNYIDHFLEDVYWVANSRTNTGSSTLAEAICKAVCASVWGDEIPDEIMARVV